MNNETKKPPTLMVAPDEIINLIDAHTQVSVAQIQSEKKRSTMIVTNKSFNQNNLMKWCAFILSLGTVILIWRFLSILILATWLSGICTPLLEWLVNCLPLANRCKEKRSRSAVAAFLLVFLVLVVILPIILIIVALTDSTLNFVANLLNSTTVQNAIHTLVPPQTNNNITDLAKENSTSQTFLEFIKGGKNATFHLFERFSIQRESVTDVVQIFGGKALSVISTVAGATAQFVIGILIFLVSTYRFLLHGTEIWEWSVNHSPLSRKHMNRLKDAFQETGRGLLIGVGLTCVVQGVVAAVAYLCLQIPRWYALGVLTGLCSLIPILGTAIVWIPITIGLFIQQAYLKAVIMIVVGILAIGSVDNLLRPVFSKLGSLQMSTLLLLLTIFGGLELLGAWGALLGPLIVRLAIEAIILVKEDENQQEQIETTIN